MKIIFAGTPEFAALALEDLIKAGHEIIAVYTQPDRPAGRGRKLTPSAVKQVAQKHGLPVYQPVSLKGKPEQDELAALNPDLMIVAAYGLLLPLEVLNIPKAGCINIHASLLPRWRGAAPIQRAIEMGDEETGITIMQMDVGLDTGDMLLKKTCVISKDDTAATLHDKLAALGGQAIVEALELMQKDQLIAEKQDDELAVYAHKLKKSEAVVDWRQSAIEIERKVRAFNPWPVMQTMYDDKVLRIWAANAIDEGAAAAAGKVIQANKSGIDVVTGDGVLRITRLQLPGGKPLEAHQFLNAHDIADYCFK